MKQSDSEGGAELQTLLHELQSHLKRPVRILHIGNIANNAYLNAKLLNEIGADCDVLCHSYFHIMGCPEWEELDKDFGQLNQNEPEWYRIDMGNYERPKWFAQGSFKTATEYLCAKRSGDIQSASKLWKKLSVENKTRQNLLLSRIPKIQSVAITKIEKVTSVGYRYLISKVSDFSPSWSRKLEALSEWYYDLPAHSSGVVSERAALDERIEALINDFSVKFPERPDQLSASDLLPFAGMALQFQSLAAHYDIVQAYATEVVLPMLAGTRPYCAFEHGTLRTFTLDATPLCRVTALGYRLADHVFITNGDCLSYAKKLAITNFSAMTHPIDERRYTNNGLGYRSRSHAKLLCILRHDWAVKGTDQYIRALPLIRERIGDTTRVIMVKWGSDLKRSIDLAETLDVAEMITWVPPMSHSHLITLLSDVDVVLDQLALPHFGATAVEAIAAGVPVISSYIASSTEWMFSNPAPIVPAVNADGICIAIETALSADYRINFRRQASSWITKEHSHSRVQSAHIKVYSEMLRTK